MLAGAALAVMLVLLAGGNAGAATVIGVVIVAGFVVGAPYWRMPAADKWAAVTSAARAALLAVPFALITTLLSLLIVLTLEVPGSGLVSHVPAMMLDGSALVVIAVGVAAGIAGFRRPTPRAINDWSQRHAIPPAMTTRATAQLQRLRTFRTVPAMLGLAIGMSTAPAYNVAIGVLGERDPASQALLYAATTYPSFVFALLGYLLGVLLAEVTRTPFVDGGAGARLETRRPGQYLTPTARRLPALLAAWVVVALAVGAMAGRPQDWWLTLVAAAVPGLVAVAQRLIVRRAQPVVDADALALDDTLRSSAAHALSGGASALLLAWALDSTQHALGGDTANLSPVGFVLGIVGMAGVYGLWVHYGSTHRGRRPERSTATGTVESVTP
jgi:hypothetical protein